MGSIVAVPVLPTYPSNDRMCTVALTSSAQQQGQT